MIHCYQYFKSKEPTTPQFAPVPDLSTTFVSLFQCSFSFGNPDISSSPENKNVHWDLGKELQDRCRLLEARMLFVSHYVYPNLGTIAVGLNEAQQRACLVAAGLGG